MLARVLEELGNPLRHVYSHRGAVRDEGRDGSSSQYSGKGRVVESLQRACQPLGARRPDSPPRMVDLVFDGAAILLSCIPPRALAQKLLVGPRSHLGRGSRHVERRPTELAPGAKLVLNALYLAIGLHDGVLHRDSAIGLVVGELRSLGHEKEGHHLADEDDAAPNLRTDLPARVETEIHFLEVLVEDCRNAEHVSVEEQERDETHIVSARVVVELRAFW